ncbi:hypothetical protein D7D52_24395 [Nocardia yunnanensis]|uniref:Uncharacterized protein n=1 Tax=Nocardia yunnanensis TaxID=2382165 RepID=A0A386ZIN5_9NOCA|nr:hypothetical protein [Nocardia yunnanensis]AYF76439.1 hypothetical protein D7D52_24395 [Nocardia yunnanensis]
MVDPKELPAGPSAETVVAVGGWSARYARVLAIAGNGQHAFALVDTNGDGVEVDIDELFRDHDGRWLPGMSSGAGGSLVPAGHDAVCSVGYGEDWDGLRYAYGRGDRPGPGQVRVGGQRIAVTVEESGWWVWVRP